MAHHLHLIVSHVLKHHAQDCRVAFHDGRRQRLCIPAVQIRAVRLNCLGGTCVSVVSLYSFAGILPVPTTNCCVDMIVPSVRLQLLGHVACDPAGLLLSLLWTTCSHHSCRISWRWLVLKRTVCGHLLRYRSHVFAFHYTFKTWNICGEFIEGQRDVGSIAVTSHWIHWVIRNDLYEPALLQIWAQFGTALANRQMLVCIDSVFK